MRKPFTRWIAPLAILALALTACEDGGPTEVADDLSIELKVVSGTGQSALAGTELLEPLVVKVERERRWGRGKRWVPKPHQLVNFVVVEGGGSVFAGASMTNWKGIAQDYWTLGPEPGLNVLEVRAVNPYTGDKQVFATFEAMGLCEPVDKVTVTPADAGDDLFLLADETVQLTATFENEKGETLTGCAVEWKSSNDGVATVEDGLVTAVTLGDATITATSQGTEGSANVTVRLPPVRRVELDFQVVGMQLGGAPKQLVATLFDAVVGGNILTGRVIEWESSNTAIATVAPATGPTTTITAVAVTDEEPIIITATSEGVSATAEVTVSEPPATGPTADEWEFNGFDEFGDLHVADLGQIGVGQELVFSANFHAPGVDGEDWYSIEALLTPTASCGANGEEFDITVVLDDIPGPAAGFPSGSEYDMWLLDEFGGVLSNNWEFWQTAETNTAGGANGTCAADHSMVYQIRVKHFVGPATNDMYTLTVTLTRRP